MPDHRHLKRLESVWLDPAIYFVTTCVQERRPLLANVRAHEIIGREFQAAPQRHGWWVGRYVIMPDHIHFFCTGCGTPGASSLSRFVGSFKEWTAKALAANGARPPVWQKQFFDHVLRTAESSTTKWVYVRENPVRAGLVTRADDWPYAGEIEALETKA